MKRVGPQLARAFGAALGVERGQEAYSEAALWATEHWERLGEMQNPAGYLYRVGISRTRRRPRPRGAVGSHVGEPQYEPALARALGALSSKQRVCVALVVEEGETYQTVADFLGVSRATVQRHVERGMRRLRSQLGVPDES